ncbi:MAG TPA: hypothetical protein VF669_02660 [Tepidisphaeraceae bacterium]|jgi:hypothetical protein
MKRFLTLTLAAIFSASIIGCHASADVDHPDNDGRDSSYKKTTRIDRDGDKTTRIETRTDR